MEMGNSDFDRIVLNVTPTIFVYVQEISNHVRKRSVLYVRPIYSVVMAEKGKRLEKIHARFVLLWRQCFVIMGLLIPRCLDIIVLSVHRIIFVCMAKMVVRLLCNFAKYVPIANLYFARMLKMARDRERRPVLNVHRKISVGMVEMAPS